MEKSKYENMLSEWEHFKGTSMYKMFEEEYKARLEAVWDLPVRTPEESMFREREVGRITCLEGILHSFDEYLEQELEFQKQQKAAKEKKKEDKRLANLRRGV